ncbi:MAG: Transcriptional regulator, Crp/Fnr family [Candidatus Amesbacteria bacterium GW2011_GWA2_42_12]|uniref:Transcriptional regulator, Crp/Fnr family n=1 Tax=Candidatus Amesbacteria bacterium GW2011_GWA2_42_12 TaxID=1618356 RepID=A0A0G1B124_9BACT|nr:MAG: Transcriptional regulator, Crp/Fnr family [Candidatus Amesbacteria bacterium GW2011_GWA2_42_12]
MTNKVDEKIHTFFQQFPGQQYNKGKLILSAGLQEDHFFFIETGAVKMTTTSGKGQNLVLHIFNPRSCFPLLTLVNQNINTYDFVTLTPTIIHKVPQEKVLAFLQENVDVLFEFQLCMLKGIQGLVHRIEQSAFVPAYNQVAGLLLYFVGHFSDHSSPDTKKAIKLRVTHQEIAAWLGLTRENVSIQMKQLERDGFISKKDKRIEIIDVKKLKNLANPYAVR